MTEPSLVNVVVTVDEAHLPNIQTVVDNLRIAGLQVSGVLSLSGIITGAVARESRSRLKTVDGVVDVEDDQEMRAL